ncbi:MAG: O-antigen ligase family protein [Clostridia bacterium]|nr:O-antigen ligase family protein [Clostridia bacterium]
MNRTLQSRDDVRSKNIMVDLMALFCIVCRLGFPGNLGKMFSESLTQLLDYASSFLQLVLIFLASSDTLLEIRLLDLKKKYWAIYALLAGVFVVSLLGVSNRSALISTFFRFTLTALFGIWLADYYDVERLIDLLYAGFLVFIGANLLMLTVFRGQGYYFDEEGRYLFRGILERKNAVGEEIAHGLALQAAMFRVKKMNGKSVSRIFFAAAFAQVFMLIAAKATGALFTAAIPFVYLFVIERMLGERGRIQWGVLYAVVSIGFLFIALTILPVFAPFLESLGKDATLSNRTFIWEGVISFMQKSHTFVGYGLLMFWNDAKALRSLQFQYHRNSWFRTMSFGSHNVLLEMWLDIGLLGIAIYLFSLIYCFNHPRRMREAEYLLISAVMTPFLVRGLTERCFSNANYTTMFLFMVLALGCNWRGRRTPAGRRGGRNAALHDGETDRTLTLQEGKKP